MGMKHIRRYLHLAFLMTTVFSLSPRTKANYTHLWANNNTIVWDPDIQNKTGRNQNQNINTNSTTPKVDKNSNSTNMPERVTSSHILSFTPKSELEFFTPSVPRNSFPTLRSIENTSKSQSEIFKKDVCEENNKMVMLVCLIIIAVLFLVCTLLFLSTVVLANKVSSLRRSKQVGKRQPRSNGDFLANSALWPAESDTWKRAKELTGPNLMMQSTGVLMATREKKGEEGTEKLAN